MKSLCSPLILATVILASCGTTTTTATTTTATRNEPPDVAPAQPVIPDRTFKLTDFGAQGDNGATDNTPIDAAKTAGGAQAITADSRTPQWRNLTIRNVSATACRVRAGLIAGLPEAPAENITLDGVTIEAPLGLRLADSRGITLRNVHITAAAGPEVIADGTVSGLTRDP